MEVWYALPHLDSYPETPQTQSCQWGGEVDRETDLCLGFTYPTLNAVSLLFLGQACSQGSQAGRPNYSPASIHS